MALVLDLGVQKDLSPEVVFAGPGLVSCLVGDGCGWISKARATEQLGPGGAETAVGIPVGVLKGGTWQHAEGVVEEKVPTQVCMAYPSNLPVNSQPDLCGKSEASEWWQVRRIPPFPLPDHSPSRTEPHGASRVGEVLNERWD